MSPKPTAVRFSCLNKTVPGYQMPRYATHSSPRRISTVRQEYTLQNILGCGMTMNTQLGMGIKIGILNFIRHTFAKTEISFLQEYRRHGSGWNVSLPLCRGSGKNLEAIRLTITLRPWCLVALMLKGGAGVVVNCGSGGICLGQLDYKKSLRLCVITSWFAVVIRFRTQCVGLIVSPW